MINEERKRLPPCVGGPVGPNQLPTEYEYRVVEAWVAVFVEAGRVKDNLDDINELLAEGWEPVRECPLGVNQDSIYSSALMVMRRPRVK